jgi:hypothetical protein
MTSQLLCFSTKLSSADMAAWVQAVGSIVAILVALAVALITLTVQRNQALALEEKRRRDAVIDKAKTVQDLAKRAWQLTGYLRNQLKDDRNIVAQMASKQLHFDLPGLKYIEEQLTTIPLYLLPQPIVVYPIMLTTTIRQVREKIELVFTIHQKMDGSDFQRFFDDLRTMIDTVKRDSDSLDALVKKMESGEVRL